MKRQLYSIDCLKGALCVMIFGHHLASSLACDAGVGALFRNYGSMAVSFFFVISGALIAWGYRPIESVGDWCAMLARRVARLWPLHIVLMLFCLSVFVSTGRSLAGYSTDFLRTVPGFLLIHDWFPFHPEIRQCWNGVTWYLSALFFCYLVYPVFLNRRTAFVYLIGGLICVVEILVGVNHCLKVVNTVEFVYFFPPTRFMEFMLGVIASRIVRAGAWQGPFRSKLPLIGCAVACCMFAGLGIVLGMKASAMGFVFAPLFALILFVAMACEHSSCRVNSQIVQFSWGGG